METHDAAFTRSESDDDTEEVLLLDEEIIQEGLRISKNSLVARLFTDEDMEANLSGHILVPFWVQPWGLPGYYGTIPMADKLGSRLGDVLDKGIFSVQGTECFTIKFLVNLDVEKPLFCYFCEVIRLEEQNCSSLVER